MSFEEKLQQREERGVEKLRFKVLNKAIASGDETKIKTAIELLEMTVEEATSFYNEYKDKLKSQA